MPRSRTSEAVAAAVVAAGSLCLPFLVVGEGAQAAVAQSGSISVTPQVVQPGAAPLAAEGASVMATLGFKPAKRGRPVVVQRRLEGSDTWTKVTTLRQNRQGKVSFTGPAKSGTGWFDYRGVASRYDGLRPHATTAQSAKGWVPTFIDEFGGTSLGASWADRRSEASSRQCSTEGDPRARSVGGGVLSLKVMADPDRAGQTCRVTVNGSAQRLRFYLNGQVSTSQLPFAQTYGTFAARIKFPETRGKHGAFWMQPVQRQSIPGDPAGSGAEIDIVEFFGRNYPDGGLASFLYNYGVLDASGKPKKIGGVWPNATRMLPAGDAWWKRFHVFSLEWDRDSYVFRVDGREHFRTTKGVSGIDEYLILSLLSSDWELADAKRLGVQPTGAMQVDWVRAWRR